MVRIAENELLEHTHFYRALSQERYYPLKNIEFSMIANLITASLGFSRLALGMLAHAHLSTESTVRPPPEGEKGGQNMSSVKNYHLMIIYHILNLLEPFYEIYTL